MIRRCPQCGSASDDMYGFCIKCGYEFPKIESNADTCPLCGFQNPEEADYCVKCGTPLVFKKQFQGDANSNFNPIIIKKEVSNNAEKYRQSRTSRWLILFGYIFSIYTSRLKVNYSQFIEMLKLLICIFINFVCKS